LPDACFLEIADTNQMAKCLKRPGGDTPPTKKSKDKSTSECPSAEKCTICSEMAEKDIMECAWYECRQLSPQHYHS